MGQTVLIAVQHDVLRMGLAAVFLKDSRVSRVDEIKTWRDLKERLQSFKEHSIPNLIIVDQAFAPDFYSLSPKLFVILASQFDMNVLKNVYERGARGYLLESVSAELLHTLLDSNESFFLIDPVLTPKVLDRLFISNARCMIYMKEELLTPREREIVELLRKGMDRTTIAKKLCIAKSTLNTHIKNIGRKR